MRVEGRAQHPVYGEVGYRVVDLGNVPDTQVARTIEVMRDRAAEDARDPEFRAWAEGITGGPLANGEDKIRRAYDHVKGSLRFQRDEVTGAGVVAGLADEEVVEVVVRPRDMMRHVQAGRGVGDCDDFSSYLAGMLEAVGVRCCFVTVAADGRAPGQFSHVYVAAYPNGGRVALDASHGDCVGWEYQEISRREEWPVCGGGVAGLVLLAGAGWMIWKGLRGAFA